MQFSTTHYSQSFISKGDFPVGCVVLLYSTSEVAHNFQNRSIAPYEIIMLSKGDKIDMVTSGVIDMYNIVIEEELCSKELYDFFGDIPQSFLLIIVRRNRMGHIDLIAHI